MFSSTSHAVANYVFIYESCGGQVYFHLYKSFGGKVGIFSYTSHVVVSYVFIYPE